MVTSPGCKLFWQFIALVMSNSFFGCSPSVSIKMGFEVSAANRLHEMFYIKLYKP